MRGVRISPDADRSVHWNFQCLFQCLFRFGGSYTRISPLFWSRRRQSTCIRPQVDFPSLSFSTTEPPPDPSGGERESEHEQAATGSHDAGGDGREATPQQRYVPWCERQTESEEGGGRGHARTHASALPAHLVAAGPSGARGVELAWRPGREGRDGVAEFPFLRTVAPRPFPAPRPIALPQRRPPMAMTLPPE